jgi:hypothetical protein
MGKASKEGQDQPRAVEPMMMMMMMMTYKYYTTIILLSWITGCAHFIPRFDVI